MGRPAKSCRICQVEEYELTPTREKKHDFICKPCAAAANRLYKKGKRPPKTGVYRDKPLIPILDRLFAKVEKTDSCWIWQGATAKGYGVLGTGKRRVKEQRGAHVILYEHSVGPIPEGLELDHLCRNRACVRPDHLEPVTHQENTRRGMAPSAISYRTNICQSGRHELNLENAHTTRAGKRYCKICRLEKRRASYPTRLL